MESLASVNWPAVIAGAIIAFLAGWLWYSERVFGSGWAVGSRVELVGAGGMPVFAMVAQFIALLLLALVIGITETSGALLTAVLAILAAAAFVFSGGAFAKKNGYALAVDTGYIVLAGIIMIAAQGIL